LNEYFAKKDQPQGNYGTPQQNVAPQAMTPPTAYGAGPVPTQPVPQAAPAPQGTPAPVAPVAPAPTQPVASTPPSDPNGVPWQAAPAVPAPAQAQTTAPAPTGDQDFENIFGSPEA